MADAEAGQSPEETSTEVVSTSTTTSETPTDAACESTVACDTTVTHTESVSALHPFDLAGFQRSYLTDAHKVRLLTEKDSELKNFSRFHTKYKVVKKGVFNSIG